MKKHKTGFCSSKAIANRIAEKRTVRKDKAYHSRSKKTTQLNEFSISTMGGLKTQHLPQPEGL